MKLSDLTCLPASPRVGEPLSLRLTLAIDAPIVFEPELELRLLDAEGGLVADCRLRHSLPAGWLPRGEYRFSASLPEWSLPPGRYRAWIEPSHKRAEGWRSGAALELEFEVDGEGGGSGAPLIHLHLDSAPGTTPLSQLAWARGHADWFFRHFDHAACTVLSYMLGDHPLLRGRVLDLGCGDGIIALGMALRCEPELLVGIDPFPLFERLPEMIERAHVPRDAIPACLRFEQADGRHLPFEDDSFDVVVSWGSLEHIPGGYGQVLREVKRVLRDGGLFFAHPGLYYSKHGSHLAEFCAEPWFHLRHSREEVERIVRETPPQLMDRSGHVATPDEYLQWYDELNKVTVEDFERDLRALEFEPWRVAIRSEDRVDYTPDLAHHPFTRLALSELYLSCWNRKHPRPPGYAQRPLTPP